jgi:hypothetical protein
MSVLTAQEKVLLDKLADSQPALNKPGLPLGLSQIKLGSALAIAQSEICVALKYSFAAQGGTTGAKLLGKVPAGCYVVGLVTHELSAVDVADADVTVDSQEIVSAVDLTASAGIVSHVVTPVKATAGQVSIVLNDAATAGELLLLVRCIVL